MDSNLWIRFFNIGKLGFRYQNGRWVSIGLRSLTMTPAVLLTDRSWPFSIFLVMVTTMSPAFCVSVISSPFRATVHWKKNFNVLEFLYLFTINPIFPKIKLKPDIGILRTEHESDNAPLKWSPAIGSVVEAFVDVKHTNNHGLILWAILSSLVVQFIYSNLPNESKRIGPLASEVDSGHTVTIFGGKGYQETYKTPQYSMVANIKSLTTISLLDLP